MTIKYNENKSSMQKGLEFRQIAVKINPIVLTNTQSI